MTPTDPPEPNGVDGDSDENSSRLLICNTCGETMHEFDHYDGVPTPPIADPDLSPTERLEEDPQAGQPVWTCWQCGNPRFGPEPGEEIAPPNKPQYRPQNPLESTALQTLLSIHPDEGFDRERVVEIVQNDPNHDASAEEIIDALETVLSRSTIEAEAIQSQPLTLFDNEVLEAMHALASNESEGAPRDRIIATIQDEHDVSTDDIDETIERLLVHGECYEFDDDTYKPL